MEIIELGVEVRGDSGKGAARALRRAGKFPGIFYGPKRDSVRVSLYAKEYETKVGELRRSHLIRLQCPNDDVAGCLVLVKEAQRHPVTGSVVHVDLYEVDVERKIRVQVPLRFVGKSAGVEMGGILQPIRREVEVTCLPTQIPESIEIDVAPLGIHQAVHISDLQPPAGGEFHYDADVALVTVLPPVVEEVKVTEGEEVPEGEAAAEEGAAAAEGAPEPEASGSKS